jgi:sulfate permease, SulP family
VLGARALADRARGHLASLRPDPRTLAADAVAAIPGAIGSVPDGMASGILAGVSPAQGLYASMAGPVGGGVSVSTRLMVVTTTSASALAAGSAVAGLPAADRASAVTLVTLLAGLAMVAAAVLRLGRFTRFVSHSVMTGFLTGVAVNIILGQLPDLTGASVSGAHALQKAIDLLGHLSRVDLPSLATGVGALLILIVGARTPARNFSAVIALAVPTAILEAIGDHGVQRVSDAGNIPSGLPPFGLPHFGLFSLHLVVSALAIAAIVLIQGAGVRESLLARRPEDSNVNGDFAGQGVGNVLSSVVSGLPVGGSVGQSALSMAAGARSRWATILCGVYMLAIVLVLAPVVRLVATPTLAAILIYAAFGALNPPQIMAILRSGPTSWLAMIVTFVATLLTSIPTAVAVGVGLSLLLQLNREAMDLRVTQLDVLPDGRLREHSAQEALPSDAVTVLDVHGSLLFAGARTLRARLPDPEGTTRPVVVLRLRGRTAMGATFVTVGVAYARRLQEHGGHLFLSGVSPELDATLRRAAAEELGDSLTIVAAEPVIGASTLAADHAAREWLRRHDTGLESDSHPGRPDESPDRGDCAPPA